MICKQAVQFFLLLASGSPGLCQAFKFSFFTGQGPVASMLKDAMVQNAMGKDQTFFTSV